MSSLKLTATDCALEVVHCAVGNEDDVFSLFVGSWEEIHFRHEQGCGAGNIFFRLRLQFC